MKKVVFFDAYVCGKPCGGTFRTRNSLSEGLNASPHPTHTRFSSKLVGRSGRIENVDQELRARINRLISQEAVRHGRARIYVPACQVGEKAMRQLEAGFSVSHNLKNGTVEISPRIGRATKEAVAWLTGIIVDRIARGREACLSVPNSAVEYSALGNLSLHLYPDRNVSGWITLWLRLDRVSNEMTEALRLAASKRPKKEGGFAFTVPTASLSVRAAEHLSQFFDTHAFGDGSHLGFVLKQE